MKDFRKPQKEGTRKQLLAMYPLRAYHNEKLFTHAFLFRLSLGTYYYLDWLECEVAIVLLRKSWSGSHVCYWYLYRRSIPFKSVFLLL
jgi:hypothetical protein